MSAVRRRTVPVTHVRRARYLVSPAMVLLIALLGPTAAGAQAVLVPPARSGAISTTAPTRAPPGGRPASTTRAWASGPAQLGYGDGDEATVVGFGPNAVEQVHHHLLPPRLHRRRSRRPSAGSILRLLRDDGAVVYLNGAEVFRSNMPAGTIAYRTLASTAIGGADESHVLSTATQLRRCW